MTARSNFPIWSRCLVFLVAALSPAICFANVGIPMIFIGLPFAILALIPVVLVESLIIQKCLGLPIRSNFKAVFYANLFTTFLGYPFVWFLQLVVEIAVFYTAYLLAPDEKSQFLVNPIVQAIGFALSAAWLAPVETSLWWMVPAAGMVTLVPAFFVSVHFEHKVIAKYWENFESGKLRKAVFRANLGSYSLLFCFLVGCMLQNYLAVDPLTRPLMLMGARVFTDPQKGAWIWLNSSAPLDAQLEAARHIPNVMRMDLGGIQPNGKLHLIGEFTTLQKLAFRGGGLADDDLKELIPLQLVEELELYGVGIDGSGFRYLDKWANLKILNLSHSQMKDENLKYLRNFPKLEKLDLTRTGIHGEGLRALKDLKSLKVLDLGGINFSDEGMKELRNLSSVEILMLGDSSITDEGLASVKGMSNLKELHLWKTKITNKGLKHLGGLTNLKNLSINLPAITDEGLDALKGLHNLQVIDLNGTNLQGPGLRNLHEMKHLQRVWLKGTGASLEDRKALHKAVPGAEIFD